MRCRCMILKIHFFVRLAGVRFAFSPLELTAQGGGRDPAWAGPVL